MTNDRIETVVLIAISIAILVACMLFASGFKLDKFASD